MPETACDRKFEDTDLTSNMEDYLEAIEVLSRKKKVTRVKDIAKSLNIKMPSVTAALNKLEEKGLINYEKYGYIELTEEGKKIADRVYSRHSFLTYFFHDILMIDINCADRVACRVEHHLTPEACRQIYRFLEFHESENKNGEGWTQRLKAILEQKQLSDLHEGELAEIVRLEIMGPLKKRLQEMGFRKGEKVKIIKYAPLGDPMEISIKGYNLSLRIDEAGSIIVKSLQPEKTTAQ